MKIRGNHEDNPSGYLKEGVVVVFLFFQVIGEAIKEGWSQGKQRERERTMKGGRL